ncbi:WD40-repeat-containing domain protein [Radiomyces spectabilis]|uniref:WD40-repeat-containing domain protein n=1 Tax=Radiomyces spectabilis TaxID=64574 RepID=UPI00221FAEE0|nr:WD40-repeat-containing domain protein [Radiomyces spectabilis]KAI8393498.1 WD40-repeat-containing domain protein [Radiomyces spectabilis]
MHTDWVNDIVVCDRGQCVISASSDRAIKLWRPHSTASTNAHTIGWHTDYVKCLANASKAGWVASAGFDKDIKIWDLERCAASLSIGAGALEPNSDIVEDISKSIKRYWRCASSKSSIYAMAVNPSGSLLATGSPEKVVRLWDPRSGKRISKLTGHTDNIRALLVSHDGKHILSGSSDSTIKLWSVKAQRCLATYETHTDSVWSLFSQHPDLKVFYAGSRDGLVTKTELGDTDVFGSEESECVGLFKEKSGVVKIVALDDTFVWTATSSASINRWLSIPSREHRQHLTISDYNPNIPSVATMKLPASKPPFSNQMPDYFIGNDNLTMYAGSVMSIPISYHDEDPESAGSIQPLRDTPDYVIPGKAGITAHLVLHNRRHVLTQDNNGEAITVQLHQYNCFDCEMYADEAGLPENYEIREDQRINLGKWVLANLFSKFVDAEMALAEQGVIRFEEASDQKNKRTESVRSKSVQLARPVYPEAPKTSTSSVDIQNGPKDTSLKSISRSQGPPPLKLPLSAITTDTDDSPFYPDAQSPQKNSMFQGPFTAPPTTNHQFDYFSGAHHPVKQDSVVQPPPPAALPTLPTSPTNSTFINRLKNLSVKAKLSRIPTSEDGLDNTDIDHHKQSRSHSTVKSSIAFATTKTSRPSEAATDTSEETYTPPSLDEFPPLTIPSDTTIIIAEQSAEASTDMNLYRGTVGTVGEDADVIIKLAPAWLLHYLLYNKIPNKEVVKLTFILKPMEGSVLQMLPGG